MDSPLLLIVDDEWMNIEILQAYLEQTPYRIATANSGERALERVHADPPDLILMDVRMGGMDGFETTQRLKQHPQTNDIPVIIVTAYSNEEELENVVACGADDVLFKPIRQPLLLLRIKSLLRIKTLMDELKSRR